MKCKLIFFGFVLKKSLFFSQSSKQQKPVEELKGLRPGTTPECYNGAILDHYTWSQSVKDIDVRVPVPASVTKARDVGVEIKSSHLKVFVKKNVAIEGKYQESCSGYCLIILLAETQIIISYKLCKYVLIWTVRHCPRNLDSETCPRNLWRFIS